MNDAEVFASDLHAEMAALRAELAAAEARAEKAEAALGRARAESKAFFERGATVAAGRAASLSALANMRAHRDGLARQCAAGNAQERALIEEIGDVKGERDAARKALNRAVQAIVDSFLPEHDSGRHLRGGHEAESCRRCIVLAALSPPAGAPYCGTCGRGPDKAHIVIECLDCAKAVAEYVPPASPPAPTKEQADHVIADGADQHCTRCGAREHLPSVELSQFSKAIAPFIDAHRDCADAPDCGEVGVEWKDDGDDVLAARLPGWEMVVTASLDVAGHFYWDTKERVTDESGESTRRVWTGYADSLAAAKRAAVMALPAKGDGRG